MPNLSNTDLSNLDLCLPPLKKQIEITEFIDRLSVDIDRVASVYQAKLEALEELKKSILHSTFSGELNNKNAEGAAA